MMFFAPPNWFNVIVSPSIVALHRLGVPDPDGERRSQPAVTISTVGLSSRASTAVAVNDTPWSRVAIVAGELHDRTGGMVSGKSTPKSSGS